MKFTWTDEARKDRRNLIGFVEIRSLVNATELDDRIDEAIDRLLLFPQSGRVGRVQQTRELVITHTPYLAIYAVEPGEIVILRLLHGAQQWPEDKT